MKKRPILLSAALFLILPLCRLTASDSRFSPLPTATTESFRWLEDNENNPEKNPGPQQPEAAQRAEAAAAFALGEKLEENEDYEGALERYRQASRADPGYTPTLLRIASVCLKSGHNEEAIAFLEEKIRTQPDSARLRSMLALAYEQKNQSGDAVKQAQLALDLDPTLVGNYSVLVKNLERQGKKKAINDLFDRARSTRSDNAAYYLRMGNLWSRLLSESGVATKNQIQLQVLPLYEEASRLDPGNAHLLIQLGELSFDTEKYDKAADYYQRAYEINHRISNLRESLAISLLAAHRDAAAIKILEKILEDHPERKGLYPMLANLYGQQNNWRQASEYYLLYCKLANARLPDYLRLVDAQLRADKTTAALETMERIVADNPQTAQVHFFHAVVLRSLGRWQESLDAFARSESLASADPKVLNSDFYLQYAQAGIGAGNQPRAEELLQKSLQLNPENAEALNCLGYLWAEKNIHLDEAGKLITRALKHDPKNKAYLDSLGWVYYQKGDYSQALDCFNKSLGNGADDPVLLGHLGDALSKMGKYQEAIEAWSKAQGKSKDTSALAAKIDQARHQLVQKP